MKKLTILALIALVPAAWAGEKQCDGDAAACVKYMVASFENKGWIGIEMEYENGSASGSVKS